MSNLDGLCSPVMGLALPVAVTIAQTSVAVDGNTEVIMAWGVKIKHFQNLSLCSQPGGHMPRLEQGLLCLQDQAWLRIHPRYMNVLMNIALEIRECCIFAAIYAAATHNFCILQQWWLHALRFNKSKADLNWLNTHTSTLENLYWKVGSALTLKFHLMSGLRSSVMCGQVAGKGHGSV